MADYSGIVAGLDWDAINAFASGTSSSFSGGGTTGGTSSGSYVVSPDTLIALPGGGSVSAGFLAGQGVYQTDSLGNIIAPGDAYAVGYGGTTYQIGQHSDWFPAYGSGGQQEEQQQQQVQNRNFAEEARLLFPWIPDELVGVFASAWEKYGDPNLAMAALRQDARYEQFFPGNRRDDGSIRLTEGDYLSTVEAYNRERTALGLSPLRVDLQTRLIEGDVSANEYASRLGNAFVNLASNIDAVRQDYAERWGNGDFSISALLENYVDPGVSVLEAEHRLRASQIGGEARLRGTMLSTSEAELFASYGLDQQAARSVFGEVATRLPTLNQLVQRHNDPDDPFDFAQLAEALVISDPEELQRISRLFSQERSMFSSGGFTGVDRTGAQTGLLSR